MTDRAARLRWALLPDFDDRLDGLENRLPVADRQRAGRFRSAAARRRFVLARTILRRALGDELGEDPSGIELADGTRGKPALAFPPAAHPLDFNLSHSGDLVVVALAARDIGVDVEQLRHVASAERLARRFFSADEQAVVLAADDTDRDRAFLRIWTQKEAVLKASGLGVGMPLREVETEPDPRRPPRLRALAGDREEADRWALVEAEIPGGVCMVAVRGGPPVLVLRRVVARDLDSA